MAFEYQPPSTEDLILSALAPIKSRLERVERIERALHTDYELTKADYELELKSEVKALVRELHRNTVIELDTRYMRLVQETYAAEHNAITLEKRLTAQLDTLNTKVALLLKAIAPNISEDETQKFQQIIQERE